MEHGYREPVYTIGIVAKTLKVCPATLRIWERKDLIKPTRLGKNRFIQNKVKGEWDNNDVQYIEMLAIPKIKLGWFDISDANKLERRCYENAPDRWVYRNLTTFAYPTKIANFEFTPYISNEIYYDFEIDKMNLNWATIGVNKKMNKYFTLGVYYRDETSRVGTSSKWVTNHMLGTNVTINF